MVLTDTLRRRSDSYASSIHVADAVSAAPHSKRLPALTTWLTTNPSPHAATAKPRPPPSEPTGGSELPRRVLARLAHRIGNPIAACQQHAIPGDHFMEAPVLQGCGRATAPWQGTGANSVAGQRPRINHKRRFAVAINPK
ncbi:hypothetical protein MSTO_24600 [Mycobacterium stomatepiae]|uniref:Uncharacterized protein n=1 Tax=Mycobacterium stomatepiae TaxID=470076 RepID=A0A7I7Q7E3_9MYCO|nr:hypothetical protein MSTO_24600 [Mycobacterium stomatepiae]